MRVDEKNGKGRVAALKGFAKRSGKGMVSAIADRQSAEIFRW